MADHDFSYPELRNMPMSQRSMAFQTYWKPYLEGKGYAVTEYATGKWRIEKGVMKVSYWPYMYRMLDHCTYNWGDCSLTALINTVYQLAILQNVNYKYNVVNINYNKRYREKHFRVNRVHR